MYTGCRLTPATPTAKETTMTSATLTGEQVTRNVCIYLGFDGSLPMGSVALSDRYGAPQCDRRDRYRGRWRVEHDAESGTLAHALAERVRPLYEADGEGAPDGRIGRQAVLAAMLESWPSPPDADLIDADWIDAFGGREWIRQGKDWEYVDADGRAVILALLSGEEPGSVRARVRSADPDLVRDHRGAANGDKVKPAY
jgi:hypothetical protein